MTVEQNLEPSLHLVDLDDVAQAQKLEPSPMPPTDEETAAGLSQDPLVVPVFDLDGREDN